MNSKIKLSICVATYNNKDYIAQALDSFLMQKTNFKFQIIVGDDCSTDGTTDILKEYAKKYPDIIKPIFREKNIGRDKNLLATNALDIYSNAKTPYIAMCDGDDYWIDEYKLQKQVDFLETHPDYSICFHPVKVVYEGFDFEKADEIYPTQEFIKNEITFDLLIQNNWMATSSVVYRWKFNDINIENYFPKNIFPGDWYLHLLHAKEGKIKILPEIMSVYRRHPQGVWSDSIKNQDRLFVKWGLHLANFYYLVYKNITNSSQAYLQDMFLPNLKSIINTYYHNKKFKELQTIEELYPTYLDMISLDEKFDERLTIEERYKEKFKTKYKKYKKLSRIALAVIIVQMFVIVAFVV